MSKQGVAATPMSFSSVWAESSRIRQLFGYQDELWFPVVEVVELALPQLMPDYEFEVVEDRELPYAYAEALPDIPKIRVSNSAYIRACQGCNRQRFTLAHELGHLVLHHDRRLQRVSGQSDIPAYKDPEWQANAFAGELLMPLRLYKNAGVTDPDKVCSLFGISRMVFDRQLDAWRRKSLI